MGSSILDAIWDKAGMDESRPAKQDEGGCQNYGPLLGPLINRWCVLYLRTHKGTIIFTTTHVGLCAPKCPTPLRGLSCKMKLQTSKEPSTEQPTHSGRWAGQGRGLQGRLAGGAATKLGLWLEDMGNMAGTSGSAKNVS